MPPALSARARLLDSGRKDKTDAHDARSAAIVALRNRNLRAVALEDHRQILRLLARRHHQLIAARTRAICRLHAVLCEMVEGGLSKHLSAKRAASELRKLRPADAIGIERKRIAGEFLDEVRRVDLALVELRERIEVAVTTSDTTVTDVHGVGPIVAALPDRLHRRHPPLPDRGALRPLQRDRADRSVVGTEGPSSVEPEREPPAQPCDPHRRARPDQSRHTRPRVLPAKQTEGKSRKEAMRCLKRRISDAVYQRLLADAAANRNGAGRTIRGDSESSAAGRSLNTGTSERPLPNPTPTLRPPNPARHGSTLRTRNPDPNTLLTQTGFVLARSCERRSAVLYQRRIRGSPSHAGVSQVSRGSCSVLRAPSSICRTAGPPSRGPL